MEVYAGMDSATFIQMRKDEMKPRINRIDRFLLVSL